MKKMILVTMVAMLSVSAFAVEVHSEAPGAVACDVMNDKVIATESTSTDSSGNSSVIEGGR